MSQYIKFNLFRYYSFEFILITLSLISTKQSDEYLGSTTKHLFHFVHVIIFIV